MEKASEDSFLTFPVNSEIIFKTGKYGYIAHLIALLKLKGTTIVTLIRKLNEKNLYTHETF
ncbi:hypothetical protein SAMN05660293_03274 [Dyadobacter psychrophilus]|uniref:Uncharacterized protein n=1 Tax=Dyadobacter psychrophilus TaxID=651661 RepID=A0A1T5FPE5_9BACT|nr:hypothetical protein SAMN05660293_03274 [Dyadobacter psychrophilus]